MRGGSGVFLKSGHLFSPGLKLRGLLNGCGFNSFVSEAVEVETSKILTKPGFDLPRREVVGPEKALSKRMPYCSAFCRANSSMIYPTLSFLAFLHVIESSIEVCKLYQVMERAGWSLYLRMLLIS
jgi:hypothetical protein